MHQTLSMVALLTLLASGCPAEGSTATDQGPLPTDMGTDVGAPGDLPTDPGLSQDDAAPGDVPADSDPGDAIGDAGAQDAVVDPGEPSNPTHDSQIQPIWNVECTPCHVGGGFSADLVLDSGYAALVGVPSTQSTLELVEPGSPSTSYLWAKLTDQQDAVGGSGVLMPKGGPPLTAGELALIEAWILAGAPQ